MAFAARTRAPAASASRAAPATSRAAAVRPMALFGGNKSSATAESPFYSFKLKDIDGKPFDMKTLKGKVVLVCHTATACGLTPQFAGLQQLQEQYSGRGFLVLGMPCNQFGAQNPENDAATKRHAVSNFGFSGKMLSKADVNGPDASPLFAWLRSETSGLLGSDFKWNFSKVLVGKDGQVIKRYAPTQTPESLKADIEAALSA
jgi:glutathione peroxidase